MLAVRKHHADIVKCLVEAGANVDQQDREVKHISFLGYLLVFYTLCLK